MVGYYDYVLALIPLALVGVTGSLHLGGLTMTSAVTTAGLVTVAVIGHAMFVRAPIDEVPSVRDASASTGSYEPAD